MVSSALQALHSVHPAVAAQVEADLTQGSAPIVDLSVPEPKPPGWIDRQKAPLQIGQLKALAAPFYTRLHAVAPAWLASQRQTNGTELGGIFPWTDDPSDDKPHALANLGQLKAVFALRFEQDTDNDGLPDLWELAHGLNPADPLDASIEPHNSGFTNLEIFLLGSTPNTSGELVGRITTDPIQPPSGVHQLIVTGDDEQGVQVTEPGPMTVVIPAGGPSYILMVVVESKEFPQYTRDNRWNDTVSWSVTVDGDNFSNGSLQVNNLHQSWLQGVSENRSHFGWRPVHYAAIQVINSHHQNPVTVVLSAQVTNIEDNRYPTTAILSLLPLEVAVDANRDGEITFDGKDKTTAEKPFRFWINNDQDDVEADEPVTVDENDRDLLDTTIKTKRDLEDFSRLRVYVGLPLSLLQEGKFQVGLKFKNATTAGPAIRVWPNENVAGSRDYLTDGTAAGRQRAKACIGDTLNGTAFIPKSYWSGRSDTEAHLIFEGVMKGAGELSLIIKQESAYSEIESTSIHLNLLDVREMYRRAKIEKSAENIDHAWVNDNPPAQTWVWDPWNWPPSEDPDAEPVTAVFVHGWRLKYMDFMNWSDSSYKRLWHQGFKGKFYSFRWATFSGDNNGLPYGLDEQMEGTKFPPGGTTYNASEYRAWLCGPQLASFVNQLPNPGRRSLFAHSMGNVIAGAALRSGMLVNDYALCNAAVSAMSYDPDPALRNDPHNGNPWDNLFFGFTPHKTPDTDGDAAIRNSFGLENKFNEGNEMPRIFNFGLPEDSALNSWVLNNLHYKPDDVGHSYYYQHVPIAPNLTYKLFQHAPGQNPRQVTRQAEAMGYVTKSLARTAGLDLRTRGSIQDSHSMSSWGPGANHSGFGEVHSAQWRWSYQSTHLFWNRLVRELQLTSP